MMQAVLLILLLDVASGKSNEVNAERRSIRELLPSVEDIEHLTLAHHRSRRAYTYPDGFQFMYVGQNGQIVEDHKPASELWLSVVGSPQASHEAMYTAALTVSRMLRHSPDYVFANMARWTDCGVGVFTAEEKVTIFPELASRADTPECQGRCDGECSQTCTFDGRKYDTLAGTGGGRALIVEDNILCTPQDPYYHKNNILVHEFAHTIMRYGLNSTDKTLITNAYDYAKTNRLWDVSSYAMSDYREYFAESTGAFFLVNLDRQSIGGMISCPDHTCQTEMEARDLLRAHDPQLFDILSHTYTDGHPDIPSGLSVCPMTSGS